MRKGLLALALSAAAAAAGAAPVQWTVASGGNDHWYEYVQTSATWQQARTAALGMTHLGMSGYLATLNSAAENRFASVTVAGTVLSWIGGTDEAVEGVWRWIDGPEAGQVLAFTNWNAGEPNDVNGGEDYLQTNWAVDAGWNDHGGPGSSANLAHGFLVEYGPAQSVPAPASLALAGLAVAAAGLARRRRRG